MTSTCIWYMTSTCIWYMTSTCIWYMTSTCISLAAIGLVVSEETIKVTTDDRRRTPSDGKSSHGLWPGELKRPKLTYTKISRFTIYKCTCRWVKMRSNFNCSYMARSSLTYIPGFSFSRFILIMQIRHILIKDYTKPGRDGPWVGPFQNCVRQPRPPIGINLLKEKFHRKARNIY
jgi:hypothetical protein